MSVPARRAHPRLDAALKECRRTFLGVALFSAVVNILMFAGPLYMLQVYDRVLASRSLPTLAALSLLLLLVYAFQGGLDIVRSKLVVRIASMLDLRLERTVFDSVLGLANANHGTAEALQPLRDLDKIRAFLTGSGPIALVDLPWTPVFLVICFLIHPWLGAAALVGGGVLLAFAILTERRSREPALVMNQAGGARSASAEMTRRNSETVVAMGMSDNLASRWHQANDRYRRAATQAADVTGGFGGASRVIRMVLQSAMLALGACLVIRQELSPGAMIASSIMMGRALAPIEIAIANWRAMVAARQSLARLSGALGKLPADDARTDLPAPTTRLDVEHAAVAAPGESSTILSGIHFGLSAGEILAVVGSSGAGKTSLIRTLIGAWQPARGKIRLDGAALAQWDNRALGAHIGYVAQQVEFFDGTIAENIARMSLAPDSAAVLAAARAAGAHDMILRLPDGYDTRIGAGKTVLSAGQRQRIGLARALYGDPFLVVLDEPNANLDSDGEIALRAALAGLKERGAVVVMVSHRPSALEQADKILVLGNGTQLSFGPRDTILRKVPARTAVAGNLALVEQHEGIAS